MVLSIATVFLMVLIAALVIGIILLYLTKPKKNQLAAGVSPENLAEALEKFYYLQTTYNALNQKIDMAHSRLNDLESSLSKKAFPASRKYSQKSLEELNQKLDRVIGFKSNAEAELEGLKESVSELKGKSGESPQQAYRRRARKLGREISSLDNELHRLIYQRRN